MKLRYRDINKKENCIYYIKALAEQEKEAQEWHENQVRKCELIRFAEMDYTRENECKKCAEEHRQLAEWLKELKQLKEQEPMLDKIRAEIEELHLIGYATVDGKREIASRAVMQIIDKYKVESEIGE